MRKESQHPSEGLPSAVHNSSLFSDYFLTELIKEEPFFKRAMREAAGVFGEVRALYEYVKSRLPDANEAETEHLFIRPVLDILGWKELYTLQPSVPSYEGTRRPDFCFFAAKDDLEEAEHRFQGRGEYFSKAVAIGDAKQWSRSLDSKIKGPGDPFANHYPPYQIDFYLRATDRTWGILTNGRHWRLYHRDTSYKLDVYYEVDLETTLEEAPEAFPYFGAFFSKEAFTTRFLDRVLKGSRQYAARLGEELKDNVYEALRLLAEGFLKNPENGLSADDLEDIRTNTFVLIYRILFLFYAEDRGLLPMENPAYRDSYSLRQMAREIADRLDSGYTFSPTAHKYWMELGDLFRIVNEGDAHLGVPPYNGGLFDPEKHPLLARWKIGDQYLALAIDKLARAKASGRTGRGPVSYRDLDIRHLGAIYEGLLEHRLRVASEDLAVVKDGGKEIFVPLSEVQGKRPVRTYRAGEVYLETDKGERKATGSYYTPDYIVKYIVQHTLGPLVKEKKEKVAAAKRDLDEKIKHARGYDREEYKRKREKLESALIDEILSIKVLDPAMGSGHFLVEAVDFLANALIEALGESPKHVEEDVRRWARREVVERCIFGVDVNPLAVELAKLSLWLYTVAKDRPLSFLDHHLRVGNSLIGAWVKDLGRLPARGKKDKAARIGEHVVGLFEGKLKERLPTVIGEVVELLRKPSDKVEDIREKEELYGHILKLLRPFKEVANAWVSAYFENEVDEADYENVLLKLGDSPRVWEEEVRSQPWFAKAQAIAHEKAFFHWELEFPEVFFEETGQRKRNPGFDAVIGNPPYVRQEQLKDKEFLKDAFSTFVSTADIYVCFYEIGHRVACDGGRFGMITSNKFMRAAYGKRLRKFLIERAKPLQVIDFGDLPVFPDASAYPCVVLIVKGGEGAPPTRYLRIVSLDFESLDELIQKKASVLPPDALTEESWHLAGTDEMAILAKMEAVSVPLKDWLGDVEIRRGVLTGCNEAFFIDEETRARLIAEDPKSAEIIKPLIVGEDVKRYEIDYKSRYLIFTRRGVNIDRYPAIKRHLEQFRERLEPRPPDWDGEKQGKWAGRKPGAYAWYEIQDTIDYYEDFSQPKIILPDIAVEARATYDRKQLFVSNTAYIIATTEVSLVALLNCRLLNWWYFRRSALYRGGYARFIYQYLIEIPIRRIAFVTPGEERARLVEEGKRLYREALAQAGLGTSEEDREEGPG